MIGSNVNDMKLSCPSLLVPLLLGLHLNHTIVSSGMIILIRVNFLSDMEVIKCFSVYVAAINKVGRVTIDNL